jgi:hypothetical protein
MHIFLFIVVALFVLAVIALGVPKTGGTGLGAKPEAYYLKRSLFSASERSFLSALESVCPDGITLTCKVRLADIFGVKKGLDRGGRQRAFNRISSKHVDFLLVQRSDGRPILGIELDDSSHEQEDRKIRDVFVDRVFSSAGLPILHVPVKSAYEPKDLRRRIDEALAVG